MADSAIKTWGQGLDYTSQTRHKWRHGNGSKTARINTSRFTRLRGRSFSLSKTTPPVMAHVTAELEDEQKSDATINRIVSAVSTVLNHLAFEGLIGTASRMPTGNGPGNGPFPSRAAGMTRHRGARGPSS